MSAQRMDVGGQGAAGPVRPVRWLTASRRRPSEGEDMRQDRQREMGEGPREPRREPRAASVAVPLAAWWHAHARDLPWRFGRTTPWGVLVSEVMSQQTPMGRVVPYWTDWMARWPDAAALAAASKAEVIAARGRLGYPRRALRLRECARIVAEDPDGEPPRTYEGLVALPGIGDYTASAVLSFAFGVRVPVVDTNVRRVLSRVFLGVESRGGAASPVERDLAARVLPDDGARASGNGSPGDRPSVVWNQATMELGALVCTSKAPDCGRCPLAAHCAFLAAGRPGLGERRTRPRQRFEGTDRQVRCIVLAAVLDLPPDTALGRDAASALWNDRVQLDACIAGLDEDGLIEIGADGSLRLPVG